MNWILFIVYMSFSGTGFINNGGSGMSSEGVYGTREECQTALEAYAKKSGASEITLTCLEGESFKPIQQRVHPKSEGKQ